MNEVRLRTRRTQASRRAREIQGMLAMHGLDLDTESRAVESRKEPPGPREHASQTKPLPYRMVLAGWPDAWRERWGRRANELEDDGLTWRDAEGHAFVEVWNEMRSHAVERN